jgi:hypothetical protein
MFVQSAIDVVSSGGVSGQVPSIVAIEADEAFARFDALSSIRKGCKYHPTVLESVLLSRCVLLAAGVRGEAIVCPIAGRVRPPTGSTDCARNATRFDLLLLATPSSVSPRCLGR